MIQISIKSPIVDDRRQFKTDAKAMRFLKSIDRLHYLHRMRAVGKKPKRLRGKGVKTLNEHNLKVWRYDLSVAIPLRVEIINTKFNQLNLL